MIEVIPRTASKLNIFDPIRFPIEIAFSLFITAIIEAESSGILVPTDIILTLIILSETPLSKANATAPLMSVSEPNHKLKPPANR